MKKQIKSIFLLSGIALVMLSSCKDKSTLLIRTWKMQDLKFSTEVPDDKKAIVERNINEMKQSFTITYNADGSYTTKMKDKELRGKWKLNSGSTVISTTTAAGTSKDYTIKELKSDKYSFEAVEGKDNVTFVMIPAN